MKDDILTKFVKQLVDEYPLADPNAIKIFEFYKKFKANNKENNNEQSN